MWIQLMMGGGGRVKTVSYSILVNGEPKGLIKPTRGLRQRDPLSPFLFLLCTKGLHGLISQATSQRELHGYSLCKNGLKLTHLLFVDDSLLFCRTTPHACEKVLEIMDTYSKCSRQHINKSKTTIFLGRSTTLERKQYIKEALGVHEIRSYEKYLGLPSLVGKRKKSSFEYLKERVWRKLQGQEEKLLSQGERKNLIKVVIQAIPTCTMSCFKLLVGLHNDLESLIQRFWWGQRGDQRKIHWVKWETMCKPKAKGGMGFKDLAMFNDALLAVQAWRLLQNENSLFQQAFKAKFFLDCSILEALDSIKGSYAWRSVLHGREALRKGARWRVGNGEDISIWGEAWLPSILTPQVNNPMGIDFLKIKVSSLINPHTQNWDMDLLQAMFQPEEVQLIRSISLGNAFARDKVVWPYSQSSVYLVKSGYYFLTKERSMLNYGSISLEPPQKLWKLIWSLSIPIKV